MTRPAIQSLLDQLTIDEKVSLLSGADTWQTVAVERLGIGAVKVTDGPNGARGDSTTGARAVCLPASIAVGASFDVELVAEVGRLLGREAVRKGSQVLLAPTINIARHPLGGRNFESFGEDPSLTAAMAVAYITGVQDEGVGACAKHFVANDVEYRRMTVSSEVDERTLREVYLAPFEAVVDAGVWSLMASYPKLNGQHCTEHEWLLTDLLRDEWGFDGLVMSDWGATHHRSRPVNAGLDLEMPGPPRALGAALRSAIDEGEVDEETLDRRVMQVLDLAARAGRIESIDDGSIDTIPEQSIDLPEDRALARRAATDGMVLLSNPRDLLPLAPSKTVAVIGPNASPGVIQGGGSAQLAAHRVIAPLEGLQAELGEWIVADEVGCLTDRYLPQVDPDDWDGDGRSVDLQIFATNDLTGEPAVERSVGTVYAMLAGGVAGLPDPDVWSQRWNGRLVIGEGGEHQFSVLATGPSRVFVNGDLVVDNWTDPQPGDAFFQFASSEVIGSVELEAGSVADVTIEWLPEPGGFLSGLRFGHLAPVDEDALLDRAVAAAAGADVAVVVVGLDAEWETESHDRPMFGLPGRQDELVERVLAANPDTVVVINAGGPVDLPWLDDVGAALMAWYPGQEFGSALADVLTGASDPGGRLPVTFPRSLDDAPTAGIVPGDGDLLHYGEGLLVGHRWYDSKGTDPLRPFGYGTSYATFEYGEADLVSGGDAGAPAIVELVVRNTSDRSGKAVVQLYSEAPSGAVERPVRQLVGFAAVHLDAGAEETVRVDTTHRAFEIWTESDGWHTPSGDYRLHVATSSRDVLQTLTVAR